jgi:F0F1-type ATP synthase membrane subunit c/vacuolar-type H+-ATPase subunit K
MTKRNVVWLIVRLVGLYLLWGAVTSAFGLVAGLLAFKSFVAVREEGAFFVQPFVMTVLYTALGLYCVADGRVLFYVLNRESDE